MIKHLVFIPAIFLIILAFFAGALAIAEVYHLESRNIIDEWFMTEWLGPPPDWSWEQAQRYLWIANRLAPLNPDILDELGRVYDFRITEDTPSNPDLGEHSDLDIALDFFRRSIALRPAWPHGWTSIALLKQKLEIFDEEFDTAIKRAATLGPWEAGVQMAIVESGLAAQEKLSKDVQEIVLLNVERGIERELQPIISLAEQYGLIEASDDELEGFEILQQ